MERHIIYYYGYDHSHILTYCDFFYFNYFVTTVITVEQEMVEKFMLYYSDFESRPVFGTVEEMLKWSGLYGLTRRTLQQELADAGLSSRLILELVTV